MDDMEDTDITFDELCHPYVKFAEGYRAFIGLISYIYSFGRQLVYLFFVFIGQYRGVYVQSHSILSLDETFVQTARAKFLETYEMVSAEEMSSNIPAVFYNKTEFQQSVAEKDNPTEKEWRRRIIYSATPRGNVIMYYDAYKLGFAYYSDVHIPYKILNAVAMKYVVMYRCRDFFIDEYIIPETHPSKLIKLYETDEPTKPSEPVNKRLDTTDAPFAKFKSYNTVSSKITGPDANAKHAGSGLSTAEIKRMNRFVALGKTVNFSILQKPETVFRSNGFASDLLPAAKKAMSYKDYKKTVSEPEEPVHKSRTSSSSDIVIVDH